MADVLTHTADLRMLQLRHFGILLLAACTLAACAPRRPGEVPALVHAADAQAEVVQTDAGAVRGVAGAQGRVFLGVPFAAPPVGALRFRAPQAAPAWKESAMPPRPGRRACRVIASGRSRCPRIASPSTSMRHPALRRRIRAQ